MAQLDYIVGCLSKAIDWIEKHPVTVPIVVAIVGGISALLWNWYRDRIKIDIGIKPIGFKSSREGEEIVFTSLTFNFKIVNHSRVTVSIQNFYLELPDELQKVRIEPGRSIPGIEFQKGARLYPNNFHLRSEEGTHVKIPILLEVPVMNLTGELTEPLLIKHLRKKEIRMIAIDQKGKKHSSKPYLLDAHSMSFLRDTINRDY